MIYPNIILFTLMIYYIGLETETNESEVNCNYVGSGFMLPGWGVVQMSFQWM